MADNMDDALNPVPEVTKNPSPVVELGSTGLKRSAGFIDEEFLPALRGRKAVKIYKEMSLNDPTVGGLLFAIDMLLRQVEYRVEAGDETPGGKAAVQFLEECMNDMSHTWDDMISEILSMLVYGWSYMEITYKRRIGPGEKNPSKRSRYTDGKIGWRKIQIRSQETLQRWVFDESGGVRGLVQLAPPSWKSVFIPIDKALLFRFKNDKNSPEGISMLRNAYRPWFFKKRLEEFEAIGVERDLAGMPVAKIPSKYFNAPQGSEDHRMFQAFKKLVSNVRRDEHEGLVLPHDFDPDTKQPRYEFELMSAGGSRQFDTSRIIERYEQRILMTVMADFLLLGAQGGNGSYAMHVDKTGIFKTALNTVAKSIAEVFNRYAIPKLFELNGWKVDDLPKIVPNQVENPDLNQLASFMNSMGGLGMEWFPDPELEKYLRSVAGVPALPDELLEMRQQMATQSAAMSYAQQQMDFLGLKQKAEMTAQGLSPEQAQQESERPAGGGEEELQAQQAQDEEQIRTEDAKSQIKVREAQALERIKRKQQ